MRAILGIFERLQEQREHCDHVELMVRTGQDQYNPKIKITSRAEQKHFSEQSISKGRTKYFQRQSKVFSNAEQSIFKRRAKYFQTQSKVLRSR